MKRIAYKFRLAPHDRQEKKLFQFTGCARFVYNKMLDLEKRTYEQTKKKLGYHEAARMLVLWKADLETTFLKDVHSQILQQKLKDLYRAYDNFFAKRAEFPRFKKKGINDSFRYPQGFKIDESNKRIYLPKIGFINYHQSRLITGTPKNITITYSAGHWYCSIQTEQELPVVQHTSQSIVGIDLGITKFATLSNGEAFEPINSFRKNELRLASLQKSLARKTKGSYNRKKCLKKISKFHQHIARIRNDYLHKITTSISKNHAIVVIEDLIVSNLSKSAKGTIETPGKNVSAKSGLNKSILDQGWHEFHRQLTYKLAWSGGQLIVVPPHYTSQTCSSCGFTSADNRKTQSVFNCIGCNHKENADANAAKNIVAAGHAVLACGEIAIRRSMKQEPTPICG